MKHIIFDWGDTIMRDDPGRAEAMHLWPHVELIPGAKKVLSELGQVFNISLATNAMISDEKMIRQALRRVGVEQHFRSIFTAKTIGMKKNEPEFWLYVFNALEAKPEEITVVGDSFEGDVVSPNSVGLRAIWLNRFTAENRCGALYHTIHNLTELLDERKNPNRTGR